MSDSESVSSEVRELLELVLKEPSVGSVDTVDTNATVSTDEGGVNDSPDKTNENLVQSMDVQQEESVETSNAKSNVQATSAPAVVTEKQIEITPTINQQPPELDLRVVESNALKLIAQYGSDSESEYDESDGTESSDEVVAVDDVEVALQKTLNDGNYRVISSDSEESTSESDSDSDVEVISVQNEIISLDDDDDLDTKSKGPIRVEGEFTIDSLPPIEDLKISVPEEECVVLGKIMSIVDQLVVVDSLPKSRPIDIDSVLFLDKGTKPLGHVFDVLGNVSNPMYCVRFNSNKQIQEKGITVGTLVYVAPRTEHTSFVAVSELMKQKGCDASWKNDIEPPNAQDFSDDEEERKARRTRRGRNNSINENESMDSSTDTTMPTQNANNNNQRTYRQPRRRRGNFNRGGHQHDRNYGPPQPNHSWHQNLPQPNWNGPPMRNNNGPFPQSLLLPPPPPPPPSNPYSYW